VGTGGIASAHADGIKSLSERAKLVAAVEIDPERLGKFCDKFEVPGRYTDLAEMLTKEKPDLVQVATPPGTHCDISIQCMEAGAWVLCEKPICASLAQLDRLADAEKRTGKYVSCVFQMRFGSGAQHLKKLIADSALGKPLVGICNTTWYRDTAYYAVPWRGKWSTELGGPTMIHGIHTMDLFLYLLGDFVEVQAMIGTLDRNINVEDVSMAIVKFQNNAMGSIVNAVLCPRQESHVRIDFQKATVEAKYLYGYTNKDWVYTPVRDSPETDHIKKLAEIPTEAPVLHGTQTAAMLDAMDHNERPPVSGHEARRTIEFITCMYKAAVTGQPVTRGTIVKGDPFYQHVAGTLAQAEAEATPSSPSSLRKI
jgi:predicted dehydrogenase